MWCIGPQDKIITILFLQGFHLEHNASARIIRSNQSLVLQKITKHLAGNYACSATNDEGETVSNQLPLQVQCNKL